MSGRGAGRRLSRRIRPGPHAVRTGPRPRGGAAHADPPAPSRRRRARAVTRTVCTEEHRRERPPRRAHRRVERADVARRDAPPACRPRAPAPAAVTPADAADAARLVAFGLQPKLLPARDAEYAELLRRYREDPPSPGSPTPSPPGSASSSWRCPPRAGMAVTAAEDSVFAVRMGDYARRASADSADRFLHGLAHLAVAAMAFPRPEDLADDGYIGRITVNGVDAFVRQACRRLEERAEEHGREHRPGHRRPRPGGGLADLRPAQRHRRHQGRPPARRFHHRHRRQGRRLPHRLRLPPAHRGRRRAARTAPRPATSSRSATWRAAPPWPSCWSSASSRSPTAPRRLLPPPDGDDLELVADAGLPFHS